ncbi:hypothetical protein MSPP1_002111 [Malassezia sp. CBS 17886]|nr:hypothetical protein MSPP1_002111 [Malassezia sp. CBS 17886]
MEFVEAPSRLEHRIDQDLFDDSEDLSLPGVARRDPSGASNTALLSASLQDSWSVSALEGVLDVSPPPPRERSSPAATQAPAGAPAGDPLAVDVHALDARLQDDSASLVYSLQDAQTPDISPSLSRATSPTARLPAPRQGDVSEEHVRSSDESIPGSRRTSESYR